MDWQAGGVNGADARASLFVSYATFSCGSHPDLASAVREAVSPKPRLLDRVRATLRLRHYSWRTEEAYVAWIRRYIFFHGKLPVVLTRDEVRAALRRLDGVPWLMANLLYGAGLRLLECCRLRVQDVDFATNQIVVRTATATRTA